VRRYSSTGSLRLVGVKVVEALGELVGVVEDVLD
jgi:hypothetical protein